MADLDLLLSSAGKSLEPGASGDVATEVKKWIDEIAAAQKRERAWRIEGRKIQEIYDGERKKTVPFNILYSNTETLLPALFNSTPRPVVQRRFKDEDPLGKAAAMAGERLLAFNLDTNSEEYAGFDSVIEDCVLDALLPGRGAAWCEYDAEIDETAEKPATGTTPAVPATSVVQSQKVCVESIKWDKWLFGFARKWCHVPWVAREHDVTQEEAVELFGEKKAKQLKYSAQVHADADGDKEDKTDNDEGDKRKTAKVWEIWDKEGGKKIIFISAQYLSGYLKEEDDRLKLTGFFPMPEPIRFLRKSNDLMPTPLYELYENQARELNTLTIRLGKVINAIKVRGAYDGQIKELADVLKKGDNELVAAENLAALQDGKGLAGAIWLMPLNELVLTMQQLLLARQEAKAVIYEITGISDILRGSSVASETATAQNIKNQWGTLRLKRMQKEVQRFVRDLLRIMLEIGAKNFNERTMAGMTGLPFATTQENMVAQQIVQAAQMEQQPPPPDAVATLQKPVWEQVMKTLRDDMQRQYRIDIETDSTVDLASKADQEGMTEVISAISAFLQGVGPMVANGTLPFQAAQGMLLGIVRKYRMGPEVEDYIKAMKEPPPPDQGKQEADKAKIAQEQQKGQMEMAKMQKDQEFDQQNKQMEMALKTQEHQFKMEEMAAEAEYNRMMLKIKMAEAQLKEREIQMKGEQMLLQTQLQEKGMNDKAAHEQRMLAHKEKQQKAQPSGGKKNARV